mmetsp:Transcript_49178/g.115015  ORF Transcript_49178/g.115015 Transcript_49178/m.115015 type:complete len:279 (-) Transcript_49178:23-859(-)
MTGNSFVCGGLAGAVGVLACQPLDTIRIQMQTGTAGGTRMLSMLRGADMKGLYAGVGAPIVVSGARCALIFQGYDGALQQLRHQGMLGPTAHALAGAAGAFMALPISNPTEIVKCNVQAGMAEKRSHGLAAEWHQLLSLLRSAGPQGLLVGLPLTALRDMLFRSAYFATAEYVAQALPGGGTTVSGRRPYHVCLASGFFAGVVAWLPVYPIDVLKTHWQIGRRFGATTFFGMLQRGLQVEGPGWLARGFGPTLLRGGMLNAVTFSVYEFLQTAWQKKL